MRGLAQMNYHPNNNLTLRIGQFNLSKHELNLMNNVCTKICNL